MTAGSHLWQNATQKINENATTAPTVIGEASVSINPFHALIDTMTFSSYSEKMSVFLMCLCGVFFLLGTVFPDCDHKDTKIGKVIPLWRVMRHRTWTHSIWFVLLCVVLGFCFVSLDLFVGPLLLWFAAGYFGHLFWDDRSVLGVCYFYPFTSHRVLSNGAVAKVRHRITLYKTGRSSETLVTCLVCAIAVVCVHVLYWYLSGFFHLP
jgi:membrane-bound metal-dependent hydrolase YbcI (DUF457 family)